MFLKKPKIDFSEIDAAASAGVESDETRILWGALRRALLPKGGTVEALQSPDGRWIGTLRIAGERVRHSYGNTAILSMLRCLIA